MNITTCRPARRFTLFAAATLCALPLAVSPVHALAGEKQDPKPTPTVTEPAVPTGPTLEEVQAQATVDAASAELANANTLLAAAQARLQSALATVELSEQQVRQATRKEVQANKRATAARLALKLFARSQYMQSTGVDPELSTAAGFIANGPENVSGLARQQIVVDRISFNSVQDAAKAVEDALVAANETTAAMSAYTTSLEARDAAAVAAQTAAEQVANAQTALEAAETVFEAVAERAAQTPIIPTTPATPATPLLPGVSCPTGPGGQGDASADTYANAQQVWSTLIQAGFTEQAAAGVLGNLQQESNINPKIVQSNGVGHGLAQWSAGGRWDTGDASLLSYAEKNNLDPWSADTQTRFMIWEMENGWGGFDLNYYRSLTNTLVATRYFHDMFERSADSPSFVDSVRGGYADDWFNRLHGSKPLPPTTPGSC